MKHTAKLLALVLALATVMTFGLTFVSAADDDPPSPPSYTITIGNAVEGVTYNAYRILDFESVGADSGVYKLNATWRDFFEQTVTENGVEKSVIDGVYVDIDYGEENVDTDDVVKWHKDAQLRDADVKEFAKLACKWRADHATGEGAISAEGTATGAGTPEGATEPDPTTITVHALGYYLVDTNLGTICSLDTTNTNVTIFEKNEVPTVDKVVEDDVKNDEDNQGATNTWNDNDDAQIGETVNYKSYICVPFRNLTEPPTDLNIPDIAGAQGYVFHDKMTAGLTFINETGSVTVSVAHGTATGNPSNPITYGDETPYTANIPDDPDTDENEAVVNGYWELKTTGIGDDTFQIEFKQAFLDKLLPGDRITISYSATVNDKAVIGGGGNTNTCQLEYGEGSEFDTPTVTTTTDVWKFNIFKHNSDNEGLPDAEFILYESGKNGGQGAELKFKDVTGTDDPNTAEPHTAYPANTYLLLADQDGTGATLKSSANGYLYIQGLDEGYYLLHEEKAPYGYNPAGDIRIHITDAGKVEVYRTSGDTTGWVEQSDKTVNVLNNTGNEMPSVGGTGTKALVAIGSILVLVSVIFLVTKKKMSAYVA